MTDTLSWDHREQPDLDALAGILAKHGVRLEQVDTGTDQYEVRVSADGVAVLEDALCRRVWAAAYRDAAGQFAAGEDDAVGLTPDAYLRQLADDTEAGALTPWAAQAWHWDLKVGDATHAAVERRLDAAVDAMVGDRPAEAGQKAALAARLFDVPVELVRDRPAEPAPEPDSGTGWDREAIEATIRELDCGGPVDRARANQLRSLLADRDDIHGSIEYWFATARDRLAERTAEDAYRAMVEAQRQRDAARAELAEALNDVDDRDATISTLRDDLNHFTGAAINNAAEVDRLRDRLMESRRDVMQGVDTRQAISAELADAWRELAELHETHLLIPRNGVVGYRVLIGARKTLVRPRDVEIVVRGDLGQECSDEH